VTPGNTQRRIRKPSWWGTCVSTAEIYARGECPLLNCRKKSPVSWGEAQAKGGKIKDEVRGSFLMGLAVVKIQRCNRSSPGDKLYYSPRQGRGLARTRGQGIRSSEQRGSLVGLRITKKKKKKKKKQSKGVRGKSPWLRQA